MVIREHQNQKLYGMVSIKVLMSDSYEGCELNDHEPGKSSLATDEHGFTRINNWLYQFFVTPFGLSASLAQHNVLSVFIGVNLWLNKVFRLKVRPFKPMPIFLKPL